LALCSLGVFLPTTKRTESTFSRGSVIEGDMFIEFPAILKVNPSIFSLFVLCAFPFRKDAAQISSFQRVDTSFDLTDDKFTAVNLPGLGVPIN